MYGLVNTDIRSHLPSVLCRTKHVYGLVNTDLTYLLFSVDKHVYGLVNTDLTYVRFSVEPNMCMVLSTQISLTFCSLQNQTCVWSCQHRSHLPSVLCRTKHVYGLVNTDLTYLLFSAEPNMCMVLSTQISLTFGSL